MLSCVFESVVWTQYSANPNKIRASDFTRLGWLEGKTCFFSLRCRGPQDWTGRRKSNEERPVFVNNLEFANVLSIHKWQSDFFSSILPYWFWHRDRDLMRNRCWRAHTESRGSDTPPRFTLILSPICAYTVASKSIWTLKTSWMSLH